MRPTIICHMITSLDGRLHPERWTDPVDGRIADLVDQHYETTAGNLDVGGWIVGRKTMASFVDQQPPPERLVESHGRPDHFSDRGNRNLAIAIDPQGRLLPEHGDIDGDHPVIVLSDRVPDSTLTRLRDAGASYAFAGPDGRDLATALTAIGKAFCIDRLLLEGGAITNGHFWASGLIDEFSTLICPALDGMKGIPSIVEYPGASGDKPGTEQHLKLLSCDVLQGGVIWLRHTVTPPQDSQGK